MAVITGGLVALLHALLCVTYRVDQIISGVVINLLALGLTGFLRSEVIIDTGVATGIPTPTIGLPLLSDLPIVGDQIFTAQPIFFATFVIVGLTGLILWHTRFGLRIRSVGEHPHAAETLGIDPIRIRYKAVVIGGLIAGLAGAWFSLESQAGFEDNMTNGTGFIALAALIFGKWRPWSAFAGAVLFGFTRALGARLQFLGVTIGDFSIPSEFLQALPYVVTIIVVAGAVGRAVARPPTASPTSGRDEPSIDWTALRDARGRRPARAPTCPTPTTRSASAGLVDDGRVLTACNVENASYGLTLCAECGLVSALHATGGGRLVAVACVDGRGPAAGAVRTVPPAAARARRPRAPLQRPAPRRELLPDAFGPDHLRTLRDVLRDRVRPAERGRHRPDPGEAGRRGAHATSRSTGSSGRTRAARSSTSRPPPC